MNKTSEETTRLIGHYRGTLRYKTISEWAICLEVGIPAIHHHIYAGRPFQSFVDRHHNEEAWELWNRWCFA